MICIRKRVYTILLFLCIATATRHASAQILPSVILKASSNGIYNGISETGDNPSIGVNIDSSLSPNWTIGVQLEYAKASHSRQRHSLSAIYIGYDYQVSSNWLASTTLSYRHFIDADIDWAYTEWQGQLSHINGWSASVLHSGNYYRIGKAANRFVLRKQQDLPQQFYWRSELAHTQISSLFNYQDASLTFGKRFNRLNLEVGYHWNSEKIATSRIGQIASPKWLFSMTYLAF